MICSYRWVNKETEKIALLNESVFYGSMLVALSTGIVVLSFAFNKSSILLEDICSENVFSEDDFDVALTTTLFSFISSTISMLAAMRVLSTSCELRKVSKEEQTEKTNAEDLSFVDRLRMAYKCRNEETPERDNSSEEGSKTGVYSFLRRLNVIKNLNLVERFSKKNPEKDYLLSEFQGGESSGFGIEREPVMQNTPGSRYASSSNTVGML